jgi:hypothetical protein
MEEIFPDAAYPQIGHGFDCHRVHPEHVRAPRPQHQGLRYSGDHFGHRSLTATFNSKYSRGKGEAGCFASRADTRPLHARIPAMLVCLLPFPFSGARKDDTGTVTSGYAADGI